MPLQRKNTPSSPLCTSTGRNLPAAQLKSRLQDKIEALPEITRVDIIGASISRRVGLTHQAAGLRAWASATFRAPLNENLTVSREPSTGG
jgi:hypothetical protein